MREREGTDEQVTFFCGLFWPCISFFFHFVWPPSPPNTTKKRVIAAIIIQNKEKKEKWVESFCICYPVVYGCKCNIYFFVFSSSLLPVKYKKMECFPVFRFKSVNGLLLNNSSRSAKQDRWKIWVSPTIAFLCSHLTRFILWNKYCWRHFYYFVGWLLYSNFLYKRWNFLLD